MYNLRFMPYVSLVVHHDEVAHEVDAALYVVRHRSCKVVIHQKGIDRMSMDER